MTIDELLKKATEYCDLIKQDIAREVDHLDWQMRWAAIATAYAQTARAMMLAEMRNNNDPRY